MMFQSRNRESYLFKSGYEQYQFQDIHCFNLVIENLIFSRHQSRHRPEQWQHRFQSRNRESYLFKAGMCAITAAMFPASFNLVIENLIFSSRNLIRRRDHQLKSFNLVIENLIFSSGQMNSSVRKRAQSFNLVIENLIFSSLTVCDRISITHAIAFQSRNRESYLFKTFLSVSR